MKNIEIISKNQKNTMQIAQKIAKQLTKGDIIILTGELGAGKTKFVGGFLEYFGLQDEISSPTFNIVNEYNSDKVNIYHFDVYRLEDIDEFYAIGGEEYFEKGICLIEWGEIIQDALPKDYLQIIFKKDDLDENQRILEFKIHGNCKLLENLKEELS